MATSKSLGPEFDSPLNVVTWNGIISLEQFDLRDIGGKYDGSASTITMSWHYFYERELF